MSLLAVMLAQCGWDGLSVDLCWCCNEAMLQGEVFEIIEIILFDFFIMHSALEQYVLRVSDILAELMMSAWPDQSLCGRLIGCCWCVADTSTDVDAEPFHAPPHTNKEQRYQYQTDSVDYVCCFIDCDCIDLQFVFKFIQFAARRKISFFSHYELHWRRFDWTIAAWLSHLCVPHIAFRSVH